MIPLDQYRLFASTDLDEARELVARRFCRHKLEIISSPKAFHTRHNCVEGAKLAINYIHYGATVLIEPGELGQFYLIQLPLKGGAEIRTGGIEINSTPKTATILNPDRHTRMIWHSGCEQLLIYIDVVKLRDFAEQFCGRIIQRPIVFEPEIDFQRPEMARWRQHVLALFASADSGTLFQDPGSFNQALIEQEILSELLTHQPSNIVQFHAMGESGPTVSYVKKAQRFIVEQADRSVSLCDIATAAGVPIRTLQHGFKNALGQTPIEVLRRERLMQVRCELASGHCEGTVTSSATRWGFMHFGRFSRYYRQTFGELPSATLLQANRGRSCGRFDG